MFSFFYIALLILLAVYGCHYQYKTSRMWKAIQKPTHTDEMRWNPAQRRALARPTVEEVELEIAKRKWDATVGRNTPR